MLNKLSYLVSSAAQYAAPEANRCPNCGAADSAPVDRKYLVTQLRRCSACALQFRTPTDSEEASRKFYNFDYVQGDAMVCPSQDEIAELKAKNFAGTERDFATFVAFLERLGVRPPARLLDFGCSWGYGSHQFANAGFETYSFEIAEDRRNYGIENLGVRHIDEMFEIGPGHPLAGTFDCFFSAHVLEHVPSPSRVFELAWHCLKPGGAFVAFTPNGCAEFRRNNPAGWRNMWGKVHPNFLDEVFYEQHFSRSKRLYLSREGDELMRQYELGFIAWKDETQGGF